MSDTPTTIDSLLIEIDSTSTNVSKGIDDLAASLGRLKKNGSFKTVSNNLNTLSGALRNLPNVHSASNSLRTLANSIEKLKGVGSVSSLANSLTKLPTALKSLGNVNLEKVAPQIRAIADAVAPLSAVKAGGLNTMLNSLKKLDEVTDSLSDEKIARFASKVELLTQKLGPLSAKMATIKSGFQSINSSARTAAAGVDKFDKEVNISTFNMANMITVIQGVAAALQPLIRLLVTTISDAMEWDGIKYQFGNAFGDQADLYYEKITKITEALDINKQAFMENSAMAASMLIGFGVDKADAREMGVGYTELAYDIWAAYNNVYKTLDGADGAMAAIRSAISGEVEPIRRAGFTIIESTLEQTAANHGLEISIETATEAQKSYLRYLTLVDQAQKKGVVGTYAREMQTAEGMTRTFTQQLKTLGQAFGSLFLPILVKVMPYLQAFVELLTEGVHWLASMFGIEIQDIGDTWNDYTVDTSTAIENTNGVTDALDDATKSAKALKNAAIGIDELNVISPTAASSGAGGGAGAGGTGGGGGFDGLDIDSLWDDSILDGIQTKVGAIKDKFKEWLGITDDIDTWAEFFDTRLGNILEIVGLIGAGFATWKISKKVMDDIAVLKALLADPKYAITISAIVAIVGFTLSFQGMKDAIENGLDGFNFAETISGALLGTAGAAYLGSKIVAWIGKVGSTKVVFALAEMGRNLGLVTVEGLGAALGAGISGIVLGIPMMFVGIYDAIVNEINFLNSSLVGLGATAAGAGIGAIIGSLGGPIGAGVGALIGLAVGLVTDGVLAILDIFENGLNKVNGSILALVAAGLWVLTGGVTAIPTIVLGAITLIVTYWDEIVAFTKELFTTTIPKLWSDFVAWLSALPETISTWFDNLWQPIKDYDWENLGYNVGQWLGTAVKNAIDFVTVKIPQWFSDTWASIKTAFSTFFTVTLPKFFKEGIPKAFNAVVEFMKDIPDMLLSAVDWSKDVGKSILDGIFDGIDTIGTAIEDFVSGFVQGFKDALGIKSPSKVFAEIGKDIIDGLLSALGVNTIKDRLVKMWDSAKNWWNNSKGKLNEYTPSIGSIKDKLSSAWSSAKSWWDTKKSAMKSYTPSIGSIYSKVKSGWDSARNWWNSKKGSFKTYTPSIGSITDKLKSAWNSAKSWWNKNVKLSTKLNVQVPTIKVKWDTAKAFGKSFKYPTGFSLKFAANGGIFDQGSLIWAGERGPEVMATAAGGKTGVMNVQQMQDAVYEGVYSAVVAAMRGQGGGGSQDVHVYLDGREINASVKKHQRESGATLLGNEVYAY